MKIRTVDFGEEDTYCKDGNESESHTEYDCDESYYYSKESTFDQTEQINVYCKLVV